MKKAISILLCLLLVTMSFAACSSTESSDTATDTATETTEPADEGTDEEASTGEGAELTMMSHIYKPWNDKLQEQIDAFEAENPGITIEYSVVEHADLNTKLLASMSAGNAPTIMGIYGPWMQGLVENQWLDAAPDYVVQDIEDNTFDFATESAEYDGSLYGYIQHVGIPATIINNDLYEQAGAPIPTTFEELIEINTEYLDIYEGDQLVQVGSAFPYSRDGSWNVIFYSSLLMSNGGSILNEDNTAATVNSPEGIEAAEMFAQLVHPTFIEESFPLGKSGSIFNGPWTRSSYIESAPDLNFSAIEPLAGTAGAVTGAYVWFWSVAADADDAQKEGAWKYLNFISNDENYLDMCNTAGFLSFRTQNYEDPAYASDEWILAFQKAFESAEIYYSKISNWEEVDLVLGTELEKLAVGEQDAATTVANMETAVNELLG